MKQLVVEQNNPIPILWDTPIPNPGPGEILIKNHYSVVSSGTELAAIDVANTSVVDKFQNPSNIERGLDLLQNEGVKAVWNAIFPKNLIPIQLGYSSSGEIVKVGKGVREFHIGDKVVSNGSHAEYVVVNENLCSRIDENTDIKEAAFTVLGSIALHGLRLSDTSLGSKVVVIGLGVIGQLVCRLAEAQGSEVVGIDPDNERTKNGDNFYTSIDDIEFTNVDAVIITAASISNDPIEVATKIARNKAKIVVIGDVPLNISRNDFYYKELELVVSKSYGPGRYDKQYEILGNDYPIEYVRWTENRNFEAFTKLLSQKQIHILDLVSEEVAFENAPTVYEKFEEEIKPLSIILRYDIIGDPKIELGNNLPLEPKTSKVNLGILGAGNFAANTIIPVLKELKRDCNILGIASSKGLSSELLAKNFKIKNKYSTEDDILNAEEIEAVLILTPHNNHAELVIKALEKGKAVYVEKPLALDLQSLIDIEESIYRSENSKLFIGFNRRFAKSVQFVKQKLIDSSANSINFRFSVPTLDDDHWTNIKEIGGGRIVGEAVHAIDLACYLFDSLPQSISANAPIDKIKNKAKDNQVFLNINFANGAHAALQYFSEANNILSKERLEVHGGGNSYILEDFKMLRYLEGSVDRSKTFSSGKGHKESLQVFFDYVRDKSQNPFTWEEIKAVSKAAIIAQDFINSGQHHRV
jgi:predicted dehydrogenase